MNQLLLILGWIFLQCVWAFFTIADPGKTKSPLQLAVLFSAIISTTHLAMGSWMDAMITGCVLVLFRLINIDAFIDTSTPTDPDPYFRTQKICRQQNWACITLIILADTCFIYSKIIALCCTDYLKNILMPLALPG